MEHENKHKIVPPQEKGRKTSAEAHRDCLSREGAVEVYQEARRRLLDINRWDEYAGAASATFRLTDLLGNEIDRSPEIGDLIRINLPGPGSVSGEGYDWVEIETYIETIDSGRDTDLFAFRVRPAPMPGSGDEVPAHFYTEDATSTFLIQRAGNKVTAAEKGRNEVPNTDADSIRDKIRNTVVGASASIGLAFPQWKSLMEGLLEP